MNITSRKILKYLLLSIVAVVFFCIYKVASVSLTSSADYTPDDWLEYTLLTPTEIKKLPQLSRSERMIIHFRAQDGSAPQINEVEFSGDYVTQLESYLLSIGYHEADDVIFGKRWFSANSRKSALITQFDMTTKLTFMEL